MYILYLLWPTLAPANSDLHDQGLEVKCNPIRHDGTALIAVDYRCDDRAFERDPLLYE
jgi:hypothetical protein